MPSQTEKLYAAVIEDLRVRSAPDAITAEDHLLEGQVEDVEAAFWIYKAKPSGEHRHLVSNAIALLMIQQYQGYQDRTDLRDWIGTVQRALA